MNRLTTYIASASVCLLISTPTKAADWTQFRGPKGAAVADDRDIPVKWSATENVRWKAALPGRGLSCPVIANGKVIVTACSGYMQNRLHVICFDEKTGAKVWERQFTSTGNTQCHPTTNMAAPTPTTDGKAVYALFATGDLAAIDLNGDLLWYRSLVTDYPDITNQVGMASSPVVWKNVVLVPMENAGESFAAGISTKTGENLWKRPRARSINWVTPIVVERGGKAEAVFQMGEDVTAFEPETGRVIWTLPDLGASTICSPAFGENLLLVPGKEAAALKLGEQGSTPEVRWKTAVLNSGYSSPVFHKGRVYNIAGVGLTCCDATNGKKLWAERFKGPFSASPVIAGDRAYIANEAGAVAVIDLAPDIEEGKRILATNDVGQKLQATPAIANGALYLRSDSTLFCIGAKK